MDIRTRLTRKPVTTALWMILVTAMALFLSVGSALMYSSGSLAGILDQYHTSIAVRTDRGYWIEKQEWSNGEILDMRKYADKSFDAEDEAWFESLDCVEEVYFHTLSAAYSPELVPAIDPADAMNSDGRYAGVMLVGEITELTATLDYSEFYQDPSYKVVTVYGVLHLEEMLQDHSGYTRRNAESDEYLNFEITVPKEYLEEIQVGRRYVLLGSYNPLTGGLHYVSYDIVIEAEHPWFYSRLGYAEKDILNGQPVYVESYYKDEPIYGAPYIKVIEGTVEDFLTDPENEAFVQALDRMNRQHHGLAVLGTENVEAMYSFAAKKSSVTAGRTFTQEEYATGARVCMISETVANSSGIQVGDTITLEQCLCDFTAENPNLNNSLHEYSVDGMQNNPLITEYSIHTEYAPAEKYTVVGLYRSGAEWADTSYAFTPNTILIPKAAQIGGAYGGYSQEYVIYSKTDINGETSTLTDVDCKGTYGIYFSIKLKNGMVTEFEELMAADERFAGEFLTVDQGFGAVMDSLKEISASTAKLTAMVAVGWVLLLALYVLLYQGGQRKNIGIMRSLGTTPKQAADYLWGSGMVVAIIGILLGTGLSRILMGTIQSKLLDSAVSQLPTGYSNTVLTDEAVRMMITQSQLPLWGMLLLVTAEIGIFTFVLHLHASHTAAAKPSTLLR